MPRKKSSKAKQSDFDEDAFLRQAIKEAKKEARALKREAAKPMPESEIAAAEKRAERKAKIKDKLEEKKEKFAKKRLTKKGRVSKIMGEDEERDIDKGLATAAGASNMKELDEMIKEKDAESKQGGSKNRLINKLSSTIAKRRGVESMEDMKKVPQMLCELGPVETLRRLGVTDPKDLAEFKSMMASSLDLDAKDPTMDLEEMTRRFMAAASYDDVEERQRIVKSIPKLEKVTQESLLDTIDDMLDQTEELEEYMVQTHLRATFDDLVSGEPEDPSTDI